MTQLPARLHVIDSHTEGEPTRVVIDGWPQPPGATMRERLDFMRSHQGALRRAVVCEPRGHAAIVGALLTPPVHADSHAGVVFFNNGTWLGMCGHGLIGVVRTLQYLGRLGAGSWWFDTPAGRARAILDADGSVTIENVEPIVYALDVTVEVPGVGAVTGDVAWGGNWFFLTRLPSPALSLRDADALTQATAGIAAALRSAGITGADGAEIDHIELTAAPANGDVDAANFVLCSGGEYDRSPCGTGMSAAMAVRHARGEQELGSEWRVQSITGGRFTGWLSRDEHGRLVPHVRATAHVTSDATLLFDPHDPFRCGFAEGVGG